MAAPLHPPPVDEHLVLTAVTGPLDDRSLTLTVAERKEVARRMHHRGAPAWIIASRLDTTPTAVAAFLGSEARP